MQSQFQASEFACNAAWFFDVSRYSGNPNVNNFYSPQFQTNKTTFLKLYCRDSYMYKCSFPGLSYVSPLKVSVCTGFSIQAVSRDFFLPFN